MVVLGELGKAEVSYLGMTIMHENVGDFQISVYDVLLSEVSQPFENVLYYGSGLVLVEVSILPQSGFQVTFVAQLSDDVTIAVASEDFETFQHVSMV